MFVRRKELERLQASVERMSKNLGELNQATKARGTVIDHHEKEITALEEHIGMNNGYLQAFTLDFSGVSREVKSFNLGEKVDAILSHLGLVESVTLENKLVPAPKKKKGKK